MLKLAFSEYHLISSTCFNLPPDLKSNCWATQERSAGKTLEVLGGGGGGGGVMEKILAGRCHPKVQPITLLCTIFDRNGAPFVYLQWQMVQLSHTYKV